MRCVSLQLLLAEGDKATGTGRREEEQLELKDKFPSDGDVDMTLPASWSRRKRFADAVDWSSLS